MLTAETRRYGPPDVIDLVDRPVPQPRPGEMLIRVTAAPVTRGDARIRALNVPAGFGPILRLVFGLRGPRARVQGMEFAGRVVSVAPATRADAPFAPGDRVFGLTGLRGGTHAEYLCLPATATATGGGRVLKIPPTLSDAQAAAFFFGGLTAADFLIDKARLAAGERLLVNGASGAVGVAAVQIARHLGARITAVCSACNHALVRSLGADAVHDYRDGPPRGTWDVVMDVAGTLPFDPARLSPGGRHLPVTATLAQTLGQALRPRRQGRTITGGVIADTRPAMLRLIDLHAKGAFRPVVGETLPFARIRDAHARVDTGHMAGSMVVLMDGTATGTATGPATGG
jgi:NADPH:quinone reductase-like Zn-dependent oxidoreductase